MSDFSAFAAGFLGPNAWVYRTHARLWQVFNWQRSVLGAPLSLFDPEIDQRLEWAFGVIREAALIVPYSHAGALYEECIRLFRALWLLRDKAKRVPAAAGSAARHPVLHEVQLLAKREVSRISLVCRLVSPGAKPPVNSVIHALWERAHADTFKPLWMGLFTDLVCVLPAGARGSNAVASAFGAMEYRARKVVIEDHLPDNAWLNGLAEEPDVAIERPAQEVDAFLGFLDESIDLTDTVRRVEPLMQRCVVPSLTQQLDERVHVLNGVHTLRIVHGELVLRHATPSPKDRLRHAVKAVELYDEALRELRGPPEQARIERLAEAVQRIGRAVQNCRREVGAA